MTLNLLFLPLLGGYLFYTRCFLTSYDAKLCDGHRLIFHAAGYGLLFCIAARLLVVGSMHLPQLSAGFIPLAGCAIVSGCAVVAVTFVTMLAFNREKRTDWPPRRIAAVFSALAGVVLFASVGESFVEISDMHLLESLAVIAIMSLTLWLISYVIGELLWRFTTDRVFTIPVGAIRARLSFFMLMTVGILVAFVIKLPALRAVWPQFLDQPLSGTATIAFLLAIVSWLVINLLFPPEFAVEQLHRSGRSSPLDRLIYSAAINQHLVQFTLNDGKVYVGYIGRVPLESRSFSPYVEILPLLSGYRNSDTKKVSLPTRYSGFYEREDFEPEDYLKIIPIANIDVAGRFREDVYADFQTVGATGDTAKIAQPDGQVGPASA